MIVAIVIGAGALHATWNAIAKQVDDRLMAFAWIGIASYNPLARLNAGRVCGTLDEHLASEE